jgi:hypothetical protein
MGVTRNLEDGAIWKKVRETKGPRERKIGLIAVSAMILLMFLFIWSWYNLDRIWTQLIGILILIIGIFTTIQGLKGFNLYMEFA